MDGDSPTVKRPFAAVCRRISWAARIVVWLVFTATALLILIALILGVAEVGHTGMALLAIATAIVLGRGMQLLSPYVVSVAKRIRVRFGLRTLLIMTVVSGIGLAWLSSKLRDVREQRQIVRQVHSGGFLVGYTDWYEYSMPRWIHNCFGINSAIATDSLDCAVNDKTVRDEDLRALTELRFRELSLNLSNVTDEQIIRWQPPAELKCFAAQGTGLGDRAAEHLANCQSLEAVELYGTKVTDAGVAHLVRLPNMYMLGLEKTALTDDSVEHLKK